jgi:broad specificity phosphatase PhoE
LVKVLLVRHGETDWNEAHRVQGGKSDTLLNERGRGQAEALALRLKPESIQAVYSSPLKRARHTAQAIARHHQLEVQIEPNLREIDVGELEGVLISMVGKRLDELLTMKSQNGMQAMIGESSWVKLQSIGGESLDEVQQRVWGIIEHIVNQHSDGVIVVVCHYFVIMAIIFAVLNLPLSNIGRLRLSLASISTIVFDGQVSYLALFNDSCHLNSMKL